MSVNKQTKSPVNDDDGLRFGETWEPAILTTIYRYTEVAKIEEGTGKQTPLEATMAAIGRDLESNADYRNPGPAKPEMYEFQMYGRKFSIDVTTGD